MSLEGRTALPNGDSQWISGDEARDWVHRLRSQCDAVIVGGGTVRKDDPLLTSRGRRHPEHLRVVLTRTLNLHDQARLWETSLAQTLVVHGPVTSTQALTCLENLRHKGVDTLALPACQPVHLLGLLSERGCNQVLWECGAELAAAALRQNCVQEVAAVIAPKLLCGHGACTPLADLGLTSVRSLQKNHLAGRVFPSAEMISC